MDFDFIRSATSKELEQFKSVCNQLLSRTYIVRTLFRPGKGRVNNPDYTFLSLHYEAVQEYLSLLDWDLRKDDLADLKSGRYLLFKDAIEKILSYGVTIEQETFLN